MQFYVCCFCCSSHKKVVFFKDSFFALFFNKKYKNCLFVRGATKTAHVELHLSFVHFKNRFFGSPISHFSEFSCHVSFLGHFPDVAYSLMAWQNLLDIFFVDTDTQCGHISLVTSLMNRPHRHRSPQNGMGWKIQEKKK